MRKTDKTILKIYNNNAYEKKNKEDHSPVTTADLEAEKVLVNGLRKCTPDIKTVSEEDTNSLSIPKFNSTFWLIDPLDGTKEFINRNGEFTCNLALIENGKPTLGFVSVPTTGKLYYGGKNFGSFVEDINGKVTTLKHTKQKNSTRVIVSKSHLNKETRNFIAEISGNIELIYAGSSLKFIKIATGEADLYPRLAPTCEWDTAAGHAILDGVGGHVLQALKGEPLKYGKDNILNPYFIASIN